MTAAAASPLRSVNERTRRIPVIRIYRFSEVRQRIIEIDSRRIWTVEGQRPDLDQRQGASLLHRR